MNRLERDLEIRLLEMRSGGRAKTFTERVQKIKKKIFLYRKKSISLYYQILNK